MSDEKNQPSEREALEERIIGLLLRELESGPAAHLRQRIEQDADLRAFRDRMEATLGLVETASRSPEVEKEPAPVRLTDDRREALLTKFKVVPLPVEGRNRFSVGRLIAALAAGITILVGTFWIFAPALAKRSATGSAAVALTTPTADSLALAEPQPAEPSSKSAKAWFGEAPVSEEETVAQIRSGTMVAMGEQVDFSPPAVSFQVRSPEELAFGVNGVRADAKTKASVVVRKSEAEKGEEVGRSLTPQGEHFYFKKRQVTRGKGIDGVEVMSENRQPVEDRESPVHTLAVIPAPFSPPAAAAPPSADTPTRRGDLPSQDGATDQLLRRVSGMRGGIAGAGGFGGGGSGPAGGVESPFSMDQVNKGLDEAKESKLSFPKADDQAVAKDRRLNESQQGVNQRGFLGGVVSSGKPARLKSELSAVTDLDAIGIREQAEVEPMIRTRQIELQKAAPEIWLSLPAGALRKSADKEGGAGMPPAMPEPMSGLAGVVNKRMDPSFGRGHGLARAGRAPVKSDSALKAKEANPPEHGDGPMHWGFVQSAPQGRGAREKDNQIASMIMDLKDQTEVAEMAEVEFDAKSSRLPGISTVERSRRRGLESASRDDYLLIQPKLAGDEEGKSKWLRDARREQLSPAASPRRLGRFANPTGMDVDGEVAKAAQAARPTAPTRQLLDDKAMSKESASTENSLVQSLSALTLAGQSVTAEVRRLDESQAQDPSGREPDSAPAKNRPAVRRAPPKTLTPKPEVETRDNAFSTFSLNVSDVAFKLAKASLDAGRMPDAETVRSEEFLNALDYHDPAPIGRQRVSFAWERARNPFAHDRDLLRFSVQTAARGRASGQRLNLVVLLDSSGSMERADRERIVAEMMTVLVRQLKASDKISVVSFARTPRLLIDGMSGGAPDAVLRRVTAQMPEGGTNIETALEAAYEIARRHYVVGGNNRVILLTDGAANLGDLNPNRLRERVEAERRQGVALDCFGVGWEGYNDDLLESLSRNGDGRYGFVNDPGDARDGFANLLAGALEVAAADVKAQVEFNPGRVTAWRQIGYDKHQLTKEQFRDNTVDAAEIGAAELGTALYSIRVRRDGVGPLGVVRLRFRIPATGEYVEEQWELAYQSEDAPLASASPALRLAAVATGFAEWLTANPFAGSVTLPELEGLLNGVPEAFPNDARPRELAGMIAQARRLVGGR